jgi:hypothetical protein
VDMLVLKTRLGTIRPISANDAFDPALWTTFVSTTLGLEVPVLSSLPRRHNSPLAKSGCRNTADLSFFFRITAHRDYPRLDWTSRPVPTPHSSGNAHPLLLRCYQRRRHEKRQKSRLSTVEYTTYNNNNNNNKKQKNKKNKKNNNNNNNNNTTQQQQNKSETQTRSESTEDKENILLPLFTTGSFSTGPPGEAHFTAADMSSQRNQSDSFCFKRAAF